MLKKKHETTVKHVIHVFPKVFSSLVREALSVTDFVKEPYLSFSKLHVVESYTDTQRKILSF